MRCTQVIGMNGWACQTFADTYKVEEVGVRSYPDGRVEKFRREVELPVIEGVPSGQIFTGMVGEEYDLLRYKLPNGEIWVQYVQSEPWASGPCIFLALKNEKSGEVIKESLWTEAEIEANI